LAGLAPQALAQALLAVEKNTIVFSAQDEKEVSFAPKLRKEYGRIFWDKPADEIRNKARGLFSWPGCFTFYRGKMLKIWDMEVVKISSQDKYPPGSIVDFDKKGIVVASQTGFLLITQLQLESGKRINAWDFIQGHKLEKGAKFD
jgi:methionyl-tRNA formyltransferase